MHGEYRYGNGRNGTRPSASGGQPLFYTPFAPSVTSLVISHSDLQIRLSYCPAAGIAPSPIKCKTFNTQSDQSKYLFNIRILVMLFPGD